LEVISKLFAGFLAVVLMLIFPLYHQAVKQDDISQIIIQKEVTEFVDAVRTKGYITPQMYSEFSEDLAATGNVFNIELEHLHKKFNPEYADPANPASFQNSFKDYYEGHYTDEITKVLFPENDTQPMDSTKRRYILAVNDYFSVKVKNQNRTMATVLRDAITGVISGDTANLYMTYGGMVINEDD
jgi:hypothetical protein